MSSDNDEELAERDTTEPEDLLGNLVVGSVAIVGGIAVLLYAIPMPTIGPGRPGPGLFPGMIGGLSALFGACLVTISLVKRRRRGVTSTPTATLAPTPGDQYDAALEIPSAEDEDATVIDLELGATRKSRWTNALVILGSIAFYVVVVETLGFLITMFVVLLVVMLTLGSRRVPAVITAVGATAALYAIFELALLVQLPDGLLV